MSKENLYVLFRAGRISIEGRKEKSAPSHPDYKFVRAPEDVHFPKIRIRPTGKPQSKKPIGRFFERLSGRTVRASELLPEHMQDEYGFGKRAEETDCYGIAILFADPGYKPAIGKDADVLKREFREIPPEQATTGDLWELHNPYERVDGFNLETGQVFKDTINHCSVVAAPGLVWSKTGSGLWSGLHLRRTDQVQALYERIRKQKAIETPYEQRFWRRKEV